MEIKSIGNKIAKARKKVNLSQAQLAQHLFISAQAVGKWERGESIPDLITFIRLAKTVGVDLNYFSDDFKSTIEESTEKNPTIEVEIQAVAPKQSKNKLPWNMSRGNWVDADFSGLKNLQEKFSSSNIKKCKFIGSELNGLLLKRNNIDSCDFSKSKINQSQIQNSNIVVTNFSGCSLKETEFLGSFIMDCDFSNTNLTGAIFKYGGIQKNPMKNSILNHTSLNAMYIADIIFEGNVEDCYFENCDFKRVVFQNVLLKNTFFKGGSLKKIKFIDCQADRLTYEFLKSGKADLNGVELLND
jgi:uncharacterized protein YjbI with pentapeptide repeats